MPFLHLEALFLCQQSLLRLLRPKHPKLKNSRLRVPQCHCQVLVLQVLPFRLRALLPQHREQVFRALLSQPQVQQFPLLVLPFLPQESAHQALPFQPQAPLSPHRGQANQALALLVPQFLLQEQAHLALLSQRRE